MANSLLFVRIPWNSSRPTLSQPLRGIESLFRPCPLQGRLRGCFDPPAHRPRRQYMTVSGASTTANYSFTIYNQSGGAQSYSLFSLPPKVEPVPERLISHAILVAKGVTSTTGRACFEMPRDRLNAICGTMYEDDSVRVHVVDSQPVKLGAGKTPGTTWVAGVNPSSSVSGAGLSFALSQGQAQDSGREGAFCVKTTRSFTFEEARQNEYFVGLGLPQAPLTPWVGLHASFVPGPGIPYQITPSKVFMVVPMAYRINEPLPSESDLAKLNAVRVDFSSWSSPHVDIKHGDNNLLTVVPEGSPLLDTTV